MRNLICMVFGHQPYTGAVTFSFHAKQKGGEWEKVHDTGQQTFCKRCGDTLGIELAQCSLTTDSESTNMVWGAQIESRKREKT